MRVPAAYLGLVAIWSTTPLAIKWSGEGVSFLFGATARMTLGLACVLALCLFRRLPLRFDRAAWLAYGAAAIGIFPAMFSVYWGAQFIPSGWIAIVFGLSPMLTALLSRWLLADDRLSGIRIIAQLCAIAGLAMVFHSGAVNGGMAALGVVAVLASTCLHCLSAVLVKRLHSALPAMSLVAGGLCLSVPAYGLCWWVFDGHWPHAVPAHALLAILYLGSIATTVGFVMYYFVLERLQPGQVALISLISPLSALALGHVLNGEPLEGRTLCGAGLVLLALVLHEVVPQFAARRVANTANGSPITRISASARVRMNSDPQGK